MVGKGVRSKGGYRIGIVTSYGVNEIIRYKFRSYEVLSRLYKFLSRGPPRPAGVNSSRSSVPNVSATSTGEGV